MKIDEAVSILRAHNEWRRAPAHLPEDARPAMGHPLKIGIAIDTVCDALADARLIAAAPDLVEALAAVRRYLAQCPPHAGDTAGAEWGRVMDQSGAAIIKATGGQT